tara:strand:+ start:423 stop:638 length:216 start_codon:yes stop_codon:yes gene_type:complete
MITSTILSICFINLAVTVTVAWRILELEAELRRRSSINHDVTQQVPIRKERNFNDITTQSIRLPRSVRNNK